MKRLTLLLILLISCGLENNLNAQDTLFIAKDAISLSLDEVMVVEIIELGIDEIKYRPYNYPDSPIIVIDKSKVVKAVTKYGKVYTFNDGFNNDDLYKMQRKNAIKFGLFSPLVTTFQFGYERSIKPGQSIEVTVGIIGFGADPAEINPGGAYLKAGFKFINSPDYYIKGMRYSHILKGGYAKPELVFSFFSRDIPTYNFYGESRKNRENVAAAALMINLGKQWIYSDVFLIDIFFGVGFGISNSKSGWDYYYAYTGGNDVFPLALSAGFKMGFLFR